MGSFLKDSYVLSPTTAAEQDKPMKRLSKERFRNGLQNEPEKKPGCRARVSPSAGSGIANPIHL